MGSNHGACEAMPQRPARRALVRFFDPWVNILGGHGRRGRRAPSGFHVFLRGGVGLRVAKAYHTRQAYGVPIVRLGAFPAVLLVPRVIFC